MKTVSTCLWLLSVLYAEAYGPHHPRGNHRHHRATDGGSNAVGKLTADTQLLQDKEHIREDLHEIVSSDVADKMSPEELEFYYFKVHDTDNNTKLDGLEILRAVQHTSHEEDEKDHAMEEPEDIDRIIDLIDRVLTEDDLDSDGYLSYIEYIKGRNRDQNGKTNKNIRY